MSQRLLTVACNGAEVPSEHQASMLRLDYREGFPCDNRIRIKINSLLESLTHLPDRYLDLLEIASYVYCTDRLHRRGDTESLEYQAWSRNIMFRIKVRDHVFWNSEKVKLCLTELLCFLSGDTVTLEFSEGHSTPRNSLFDEPGTFPAIHPGSSVALFSGGLDSTTGLQELLNTTEKQVLAVSHRPAMTGVTRSQKAVLKALQEKYPGRVHGVTFSCGLTKEHAKDENQRTRFFLYSSIAVTVAYANGAPQYTIYENGVTSLNLPKRQDLMNGRATRTTHPKTILLLRSLVAMVSEGKISIETPYTDLTKADVLMRLKEHGGAYLFDSTVSCSKTYLTKQGRTHCGGCSQCVDRRFAAFAAGLTDEDASTPYERDFVKDSMLPAERGTITDFFAQATEFRLQSADWLGLNHMDEMAAIAEGWHNADDSEIAERVWSLLHRHGCQVTDAYKSMRTKDDPMLARPKDCIFDIIEARDHLRLPPALIAQKLGVLLSKAIPIAFQTQRPKDEGVLNDQIESILKTQADDVRREFPGIPFGPKKDIADHAVGERVVIEGKYPRKGSRTKGKIVDEIKSDLVNYCRYGFVLFVVYDPDCLFIDPNELLNDMHSYPATVVFIR